jgi:multidrug efflux pump subunit AcrA (membrane-fusion protein)
VDETAIGTDQAQKFVLSVSATNTTLYRPVKLGATIEGKRIVREGLEAGERIIVNGLARVRPGVEVHPVEAGATNRDPKVARN